jgi:hypothetical protein
MINYSSADSEKNHSEENGEKRAKVGDTVVTAKFLK